MANEAIKKVLANVAQNLTSEEKRQARDNIGAAAATDVVTDSVRYSEQHPTVAEQAQARTNIGAVSGLEVNNAITQALEGLADIAFTGSWTDLVNVPTNLVYDASYVHTDNNFTTNEKNKLSGIEAGAEVNVQSDWSQSDNTKDDYIKNKPANLVQDANYVHTDNNFTDSEKNKLSGIEANAEVNVQSDWNQSDNTKDDYIKNKPNNLVQDASYVHTDNNFSNSDKNKLDGIAAGAEVNVQSDWNQTNSSADDYIKNKPSNLVQDANYVHTDNNFTSSLKDKLDGIASGAEVNVQSDWNQSDNTKDDFIKNKPNIPAAQVQSDWTAVSGMGQILNKPEIGFKSYGAQSVTEATSLVVDGDEPTGIADIKVNGGSKGILISGPYKTLLDSGIAGSKGDADHGIYIDANGVFQACTNAVLFKCTLSTTFAELEAAISAGKIPFLVTASKVIPMCRYSSGSSAWFTDVTMWGNLFTVGAHSYALTASGWAEYPKSMNTNEDIHLPSCVTAKATIAVQDAYAEWMRVGSLIIGGRGNSGGSVSIGVKSSLSGSVTYVTDSIFRTTNTTASGAVDNSFEVATVTVASAQWNTLRTIDQYSGTATVNCTYDINMFDTQSNNPSHYNIKIHKLFDGQYSRVYMSATESWGSMD